MRRLRLVPLLLALGGFAALALVVGADHRTPDWNVVQAEALRRIGGDVVGDEAQVLADSIAADVTGRGAVWPFMWGVDPGVVYGLYADALAPYVGAMCPIAAGVSF